MWPPEWRGVRGRMDTRICMTESLCCTPETITTLLIGYVCVLSCSGMSDSLQSHGLQPVSLLCPWDFPGKNTGVGCHFLFQGIFPIQGLNLCLLHCLVDSLPLSHLRSFKVSTISINIPAEFSIDTSNLILKCLWKNRNWRVKIIFKNKDEGLTLNDSKT